MNDSPFYLGRYKRSVDEAALAAQASRRSRTSSATAAAAVLGVDRSGSDTPWKRPPHSVVRRIYRCGGRSPMIQIYLSIHPIPAGSSAAVRVLALLDEGSPISLINDELAREIEDGANRPHRESGTSGLHTERHPLARSSIQAPHRPYCVYSLEEFVKIQFIVDVLGISRAQ
ncbi:hypothetical protein EVAR_21354_1 [Eumeta japonica]|uniref:Uncharacterized protein n=1 Tax=Eumeta variegata TaxID=151549 RepID=A0A4C1YBN5_EUMVA|nr:hypothetical protein EVAR_21354_1 [Eumeta japonica]